jgi:hypothetical protein
MMARPAILSAFFVLTGLAAAGAAPFDPVYRAIFPADRARILLASACAPLPATLAGKVTGTWTPEERDIAALEEKLPTALKGALAKEPGIGLESIAVLQQGDAIANHARQYAGILVAGRRRILLIAAPIRHVDVDGPHIDFQVQNSSWRSTHALGVCGGGPNQFSAQFDPATGGFVDFHFSGRRDQP